MASFSISQPCSLYSYGATVTAVDCNKGLQGRILNTKLAKSDSLHFDPILPWINRKLLSGYRMMAWQLLMNKSNSWTSVYMMLGELNFNKLHMEMSDCKVWTRAWVRGIESKNTNEPSGYMTRPHVLQYKNQYTKLQRINLFLQTN